MKRFLLAGAVVMALIGCVTSEDKTTTVVYTGTVSYSMIDSNLYRFQCDTTKQFEFAPYEKYAGGLNHSGRCTVSESQNGFQTDTTLVDSAFQSLNGYHPKVLTPTLSRRSLSVKAECRGLADTTKWYYDTGFVSELDSGFVRLKVIRLNVGLGCKVSIGAGYRVTVTNP